MKVKDWDINVVEQFGVVLDRVAAREEDDDLLLDVLSQECEEQHESLIRVAHHVALFEHVDGRGFFGRVDIDVERAGAERYTCQIGHFGRLRSGEKHRLSVI